MFIFTAHLTYTKKKKLSQGRAVRFEEDYSGKKQQALVTITEREKAFNSTQGNVEGHRLKQQGLKQSFLFFPVALEEESKHRVKVHWVLERRDVFFPVTSKRQQLREERIREQTWKGSSEMAEI